jgi:hypothetical protein
MSPIKIRVKPLINWSDLPGLSPLQAASDERTRIKREMREACGAQDVSLGPAPLPYPLYGGLGCIQ